MRCLGLASGLRRCNRQGDWRFFCHDHAKQPLVWLCFLLFTVGGGTASILSYIGHGRIPVADQQGTTLAETSSAQPASSPPALPNTKGSATPSVKTPDKPNRDSQRETGQSSHVRSARALYAEGKYQEALGECDAELRVNPHNSEALSLRKSISRTIHILNRQ
jgi:hypothetical protein